MLKKLIALSLDQSIVVLIGAAMVLLLAGYSLSRMPVDVFPELNAPTVVLLTEAPGLAADETELYVTFPIESSVSGLPGLRRVRSASSIGLSLVWIEFEWDTDIYRARQLVNERLSAVREALPQNAHVEMTPITSITGEIMLLALSSPGGSVSELELRAYAEFELRNRLLAVPGVAQVSVIGGAMPEFQVHGRLDRLAVYGLTIGDIVQGAREAHNTASAGYFSNVSGQELPIRQEARIRSVADIENTIVGYHEETPVLIGHVADVKLGAAPRRGSAGESGVSAVVLSVQKSPETNTLALTTEVDRALNAIELTIPPGIQLNRMVFRQADFIRRSVNNVVRVLLEASAIVTVILILFLMNARTTIITLTALPLSLAAALLALNGLGMTINVMTLGGLAIAVGELVDDAIIDVENVSRRLREEAHVPMERQRSLLQVIYDASNEIRSSIFMATLLIVIVFAPFFFLQGLEGRFFRPMGTAYIVSILASLLIALTVTPALCKHMLVRPVGGSVHGDSWLVRRLKQLYRPTLAWVLGHRGFVLASAFAATTGSLWLASSFGTSFLPSFNEGTLTVFLMAPPGTSLEESDRVARNVDRRIAEIEGVRSVTRRTGRAERDEHAEPPSSSEIDVTLRPGANIAAVRREIDAVLKDVPGITSTVGQPIEHRLSHILSGTPAAIAINVYGDDLPVLRRLASEIDAVLRSMPGVRDVAAQREVMITSVPIRYRALDLAAAGLTPAGAAEQIRQSMYGELVARVNHGTRRYDVMVRLAPDERTSIEQLRDLPLRGAGGATVRLKDVADVGIERTSNLIARENGRRKAVVSCNVAEGHNLGHVVARVRELVDPIVHRAGYDVHYGGQFEAQQSASRTIYIVGVPVVLVMILLLYAATRTVRAALIVMINFPLALIGGIVAVYLTEAGGGLFAIVDNTLALLGVGGRMYQAPVISIASMVGFVTLFGIAVRNGILLVNHYRHLATMEGKKIREAIELGSGERLVPILMTALSAALGLLPLAFQMGKPGGELLAPLAIVVLGGLISSTFLNLVVIPAAYSLVFRADEAGNVMPPSHKGATGGPAQLGSWKGEKGETRHDSIS